MAFFQIILGGGKRGPRPATRVLLQINVTKNAQERNPGKGGEDREKWKDDSLLTSN